MNPVEEKYIEEFLRGDTSFKPSGMLEAMFGNCSRGVRSAYEDGVKIGFYQGLYYNSVEGQRMRTDAGCTNPRHKEFYQKFVDLAKEYNAAIVYHPLEGMCVMDLNRS